jgi:membrane-associated phospholipid phosphatase
LISLPNKKEFWNNFFLYGTKLGEEPAYLLAVIILLFIRFRHALAVPLIGIMATLVSFVAKWIFYVDRPSAYFEKMGLLDSIILVENVRLNTGATSFPSGHTLSAFALFTFFVLCLPQKGFRVILLFLLPLMVGVSRVYLVQHFWQDIPAGALLGVILASFIYMAHLEWGKGKTSSWLDKQLILRKR